MDLLHLPAKDLDLVAHHHPFDVAFALWTMTFWEQAAQDEVEERERHRSPSGAGKSACNWLPGEARANRGF